MNQDGKKVEIGDRFDERNLDFLALSDTKLKWELECFSIVQAVKAVVTKTRRATEGAAHLMKRELWVIIKDCKEVSLD